MHRLTDNATILTLLPCRPLISGCVIRVSEQFPVQVSEQFPVHATGMAWSSAIGLSTGIEILGFHNV